MNRHVWRGAAGLAAACFLTAQPAVAQLEDNLSSLSTEQVEGYLGPLASGLSTSLNSGIFKSGHVPTTGFNLTVDVKAAYMSFSDEDRVFTTPEVPGYPSTEAPTVIGDEQSVAVDHETLGSSAQFVYPGGFDMGHFGVAVPQVTIGSILGTRAMVRYISLSLGDEDEDLGDFEMLGIGGQHSVSQYLPGIPVDLAVGAMWQSFKIGDGIVDASAFAVNVTGSKRFGKVVSIEPYVGVGLDSFAMEAEYETTNGEKFTAEFDRQNDGHLTLGTGINLPVLKIHGEFDIAAQTGFAGGLSFGI
jgi:hypothetical protein